MPVGEVRVAELREGVVAHVEHPLREVPLARDREVPREVEVVAGDPRVLEHREDVLVEVRLARGVGAAAVRKAANSAPASIDRAVGLS